MNIAQRTQYVCESIEQLIRYAECIAVEITLEEDGVCYTFSDGSLFVISKAVYDLATNRKK